jgi:hypothetical protein
MLDRRREQRIPARDRIAVKVLSSPGAPDMENQTLHCTMHDASLGGLNFGVYTHVPVGSTVDIALRTEDSGTTLRRSGTVVWEHDVQEGIVMSHRLGVQFLPQTSTAAHQWRMVVEGLQLMEAAV